MNLEKSKIVSIGDIVNNGGKNAKQLNLKITFYQRPYRWTDDRITDLFDDYMQNRKMAEGDKIDPEKAKQYFLGAVVLVEKKDNDNCCQYEVVDGQQRLTTLFLMNYLKFCLLRCQIEELIQHNPSNIKQEMEAMISCYYSFIGTKNCSKMTKMKDKLYSIIDTHGTAAWTQKEIDTILKPYRKAVGLPDKKDLTDREKYYQKCVDANTVFLSKEKFCLDYAYDDYTEGLREALSQLSIIYEDNSSPDWAMIPTDDSTEWPFVNRAKDILYNLADNVVESDTRVLIKKYIGFLDELLNKLTVCEIITDKPDDAYKLFETLNDRSEGVSDLELMKDQFYMYYVKTSGDGRRKANDTLIEMDSLWVKSLNLLDKDVRTWIAYCSTVFITGTGVDKQNDKLTTLIRGYLQKYVENNKYTKDDIARDFDVFEKISILIQKTIANGIDNIAFRTENEKDASIVKRTLGMLIQLDYKAVATGVICDILYNYEPEKGRIDFENYIDEVFDENTCIKKYNVLWEETCVIWKTTLLAEDFKRPKIFADQLVDNRNIRTLTSTKLRAACVTVIPTQQKEIKDEFERWASTWNYRKNPKEKLKIKLLFFHLMLRYNYKSLKAPSTEDELEYMLNMPRTFTAVVLNQDLDHIEGETKKAGRETEFYKYDDITRLNEINSIANMMILDKKNNQKKQNPPMKEGIDFYKANCSTHWLINEMDTLYSKNHCKNKAGNEVPKKDFFDKRSARLIEYFYKIAQLTDSTRPVIKVSKP